MKLRIHHFFDIIRDLGAGKSFAPHPYLHSYHKVAQLIQEDKTIHIELIVGFDDVCEGCIHLQQNLCVDSISHRHDFTSKEAFNNYLDERILKICKIDKQKKYTPELLLQFVSRYLENIEFIYEGNNITHTLQRKKNVEKGYNYFTQKFNL